MRSKCAWRGISWYWFDQSAMGTLSCALSVPGVASVGSGLIRAQWVSLSEPGVESVGSATETLSCALSVPGMESVGSAMGTLSCALSVPGVASVGSGLIRAQWGLCHAL